MPPKTDHGLKRKKPMKGKAKAPTAENGKRARSPDNADSEPAVDASASSDNRPSKRAKSHPEGTDARGSVVQKYDNQPLADSTNKVTAASLDSGPANKSISSEASAETKLKGNFDIYSMNLKYEALHAKILSFQAKKDKTAQLFLPDPETLNSTGLFRTGAIQSEKDSFITSVSDGPGVHAHIRIVDGGYGIESSSGVLKLKQVPIWTKSNVSGGERLELFEGHFAFHEGPWDGDDFETAVWAVRAKKDDDGKEIGLGDS
ncbi:hypothetical protein DFH11DRAFT_1546578 [Phellopilus nigrolimitatus]|nr:hypothetical protein DFH11DRAFT_1546578 [Phellopilus nigrolimitatus]